MVTDISYSLLDKPTTTTRDIDTSLRANTTTTYDGNENILSLTYPNGMREEREYDTHNRLTRIRTIGDTTHIKTYTYDANSNILTEDTDGVTLSYAYDGYDRKISTTDALGTKVLQSYSTGGDISLIRIEDASGNILSQTTFVTDILGRKLQESQLSESGASTTTYTYDANGNILTETDPLGNTTTYLYDILGRLTEKHLANGYIQSWKYDGNNNVIEEAIGTHPPTRTVYDRDNRRISVTDPLGNTTNFAYNALGQVTKITDPAGIETIRTYNTLGNVLTETRDGKEIVSVYDVVGNRTSLRDANHNTTTYLFNGDNQLASEVLPDGNRTTYTYDARGNIHTKTDPNGSVTTYTYDALNRVVRRDYALAP